MGACPLQPRCVAEQNFVIGRRWGVAVDFLLEQISSAISYQVYNQVVHTITINVQTECAYSDYVLLMGIPPQYSRLLYHKDSEAFSCVFCQVVPNDKRILIVTIASVMSIVRHSLQPLVETKCGVC